MNIESRLAKQEGINKSRSEKVENAKAYAIKHFGTSSPAALKRLYETIKPIEDELSLVNEKASQHLEVCLSKVENDRDLSEQEIEYAQLLVAQQRKLKAQIQFHRDKLLRQPPLDDTSINEPAIDVLTDSNITSEQSETKKSAVQQTPNKKPVDQVSTVNAESDSFSIL